MGGPLGASAAQDQRHGGTLLALADLGQFRADLLHPKVPCLAFLIEAGMLRLPDRRRHGSKQQERHKSRYSVKISHSQRSFSPAPCSPASIPHAARISSPLDALMVAVIPWLDSLSRKFSITTAGEVS